MKYLGAYMLAVMGGNASPGEGDVKKILESCGIEVDTDSLTKVLSELSGKDVMEVIAEGKEKLASVPSGGAAAGGAPAAGAEAAAAPAEAAAPSSDEESDAGSFDLFD